MNYKYCLVLNEFLKYRIAVANSDHRDFLKVKSYQIIKKTKLYLHSKEFCT